MCVCAPTGQCVCKEGFTGRQCDTCAFGYRGFPECVRCECNSAGSTNSDPCAPCTCKVSTDSLSRSVPVRPVCDSPVGPQVNVMGAHCDLCKPGFYNLQDSDPLGCTDCFCFGVSDVCESSTWSTAQVRGSPAHRCSTQVLSSCVHVLISLLLFRCFTRMIGSSHILPLLRLRSSTTMTFTHLATPHPAPPTRIFCCGQHLTVSLVTR